MEFVVAETRRPFKWFYDTATQLYIRKDEGEQVNAFIRGVDLPDPEDIRLKLHEAMQRGHYTGRTDADPVTRKLWSHWNANLNPQLQL